MEEVKVTLWVERGGTHVILALRKRREEVQEFKASLCYTVSAGSDMRTHHKSSRS